MVINSKVCGSAALSAVRSERREMSCSRSLASSMIQSFSRIRKIIVQIARE